MIEKVIWLSLLKISESTKAALLEKLGCAEEVWNYSRDSGWLLSGDKNELKVKSQIIDSVSEAEI